MKYYQIQLEGPVFSSNSKYDDCYFLKSYYEFLGDYYAFPTIYYIEETLYSLFGQSFMPGYGIFINEEVSTILQDFKIKNGKIFENITLTLEKKDLIIAQKYHYLQLIHFDITSYIDTENSEFWQYCDSPDEVRSTYKFETINNIKTTLLAINEGYKTMPNVKTLVLNDSFWNEQIDVFYVPRLLFEGFQGLIVSEKVIETFEKNNISGVWAWREMPFIKVEK